MGKRMAGALALMLALALSLVVTAPAVDAEYTGGGGVYLLDNGASAVNATTDWRAQVVFPAGYGVDTDPWVFAVSLECLNLTGSAAAATYTVTVYVSDGTLNVSDACALAGSLTEEQTGNASIANTDLLTPTETGVLTITLKNATGTVIDTYSATIEISAHAYESSISEMIPLIISIAILAFVIELLIKVMGDVQKNA